MLTSLLLAFSLLAGAQGEPAPAACSSANLLAWAVTRTLAGNGNFVCSPFSLRRALLLLRLGSSGDSGVALGRLLGLTDGAEPAAELAIRAETAQLARLSDENTWHSAEAVFVQRGTALRRAYAERLTTLGSLAEAVSFPAEALARINAWVSQKTAGRIAPLFTSIDPDVVVVLVNAVELQAKWAQSFGLTATAPEPFRGPRGEQLVPTMHAMLPARMASHGGWQVLELPYRGDRLVFDCLLPPRGASLQTQLGRLDWSEVESLVAQLELDPREEFANSPVQVSLPRFALQTTHDQLYSQLVKLGLPRPLDLSGIAAEPMEISQVVQKARIEVDEQGTRAAAATAVVVSRGGGGTASFRADRPFLFLVRDRVSGILLFTGQVVDPTAS